MNKLLKEQLQRIAAVARDDREFLKRLVKVVDAQYDALEQQSRAGADRAADDDQLRIVLDNVKDAIISADRTGTVRSVNLTGERIFEASGADIVGGMLWQLIDLPSGADAGDWLTEMAASKDSTQGDLAPVEVIARRADGAAFPADIVVSQAKVDGEPIYVVGLRDMSERQAAEDALRESEARYRFLVENAPEAIVVFDAEAERFVDANAKALALFGVSRAELLELGPADVSPARQPDGRESAPEARAFIERAMHGETVTFEWTHCDAHGRETLCEVSLAALTLDGRRLVRGSMTDISERKRAETIAEGERQVLEKMTSNAPMEEALDIVTEVVSRVMPSARSAILLLEPGQARLQVASSRGLPESFLDAVNGNEDVALPVLPAGDNEDSGSQTAAETIIAADIGTDPIWAEHRALARDHGLASAWSTPIRSADDELLGAFCVYFEAEGVAVTSSFDLFGSMTRLAGLAIQRKRSESALRASEERFRGLFENVLDGVYQVDADGALVSANPALVKMLGYDSEAELREISHTSELYADPEERAVVMSLAEERGEVRNAELRLRRKDGSELVALENARAVRDPSGSIVGYEGTLSDITERKCAELAVFREKERAEVTLNSIADGVITTDDGGFIDYMNPVAQQLAGWPLEDAAGLRISEVIEILHDETREPIENPVEACLRDGAVTELGQNSLLVNREKVEVPIQDSAAPIRNRAGDIVGAVMVFHDVSKERRLRRQLAYHAIHDSLTGLINRREFERRLRRALEMASHSKGISHVLLYVDLDQFKVVNDTCGHSAGDQLLKQVTSLIRRQVRGSDVVSRLGGDEFGVLLERCNLPRAIDIADTLRQGIHEYRFVWKDAVFDIGASIGVVEVTEDSESMERLLSSADVACYAAKDSGRNRIHVYQHGDAAQRHAEMQWVSRVTRALEEGRLDIYYQPIVPVGDNEDARAHYELLIRMRDEAGKMIPPSAFIPAAERYNLMPTVDRWIIQQALRNLAPTDEGDLEKAPYTLAINLSGTSLSDDKFLQFVIDELDQYKLPPGAICFEITETAAISNLSGVQHLMTELRSRGCEFSLDDFGSGLSSFAYLKNLPVDYLKIDGHFVRSITDNDIDRSMVDAIHKVGSAMGIRTVAEQVESRDVLDVLVEIGIDYAQGYLIAAPAPASKFHRLLNRGRRPDLRLAGEN